MADLLHILTRGDDPSLQLARRLGGEVVPAEQPLRLWRALRAERERIIVWGDVAMRQVLRLGVRDPRAVVQVAPPTGSRVVADVGRLVCFTRRALENSIRHGCPSRRAVVALPVPPDASPAAEGDVRRVLVPRHVTHDAGHRPLVLAATILTLAGWPLRLVGGRRGPMRPTVATLAHQLGGPAVWRPDDPTPPATFATAAEHLAHPIDHAAALAAGLPCVTVAGPYHDALAAPAEVSPTARGRDLARTLRRVRESADLRAELAECGRAFVAEQRDFAAAVLR